MFKPMNADQVKAKINAYVKSGAKPALRYKSRSHYFENYKDSCGFNPETGAGHSYGWYALTKVINGQLVLNSYTYSIQTAKHIGKMRSTLRMLGLSFVELEAPKGLQNLDVAAEYALAEQSRELVKSRHARAENKGMYERRAREYAKSFALILKLGGKSETNLLSAIRTATLDREQRLASKRAA